MFTEKFCIFMIFCFISECINLVYSTQHGVFNSSNEYLNSRFEIIKNEITLVDQKYKYDTDNYFLNFDIFTTEEIALPLNCTVLTMFNFFNKSFLLIDSQIFCVSSSSEKFVLQHCYQLEHLNGSDISFVKTSQTSNTGLLLAVLPTGFSYIYGYLEGKQEWSFIHTIKNEDLASDAAFFIQNTHLYLAVVNTNFKLSPLTMYKWTGFHFDEEDKILIGNYNKVVTFKRNAQTEIIIVTKSTNENQHHTAVFEFKSSKIKKIQDLKISNPNNVLIYTLNQNIYVGFVNNKGNTQVYWWTGSRLIQWFNVNTCSSLENAILMSFNNNPAIFLVQKGYLSIFQPFVETWKLISKVKLNENIRKHFDYGIIKDENNYFSIMFYLTYNDTLVFSKSQFNIRFTAKEKHFENKDTLLQCLAEMQEIIKQKETNDKNATETNKKSSSTFSNTIKKRENVDFAALNAQVDDMFRRINKLKSQLNELFYTDTTVLQKKTTINGNLQAKVITAPNIFISALNDINWAPNQWLSYSKPQTVTGKITIGEIQTDKLFISHGKLSPENLVLLNGNQNLTGSFIFDSLTVDAMYTSHINDILFKNVYITGDLNTINGKKQFWGIKTNNMSAESINGKNVDVLLKHLQVPSFVTSQDAFGKSLTNLFVGTINGISIETLYNTTFKKGKSNNISGNIAFSTLTADHITAGSLNKNKVDELLTTSTEQVISANFRFKNVNAVNLQVILINNVDFNSEVVTLENNRINGPISIDNIRTTKDLFIHDNNQNLKLKGFDHIIGSEESDLLQIYDAKVVIKGNLVIKNIKIANAAKIIVDEFQFDKNITEKYWSKVLNQEIPVHFEALKGVTTTSITVDKLNSLNINNFLLNNLEETFTTFVFENLTILGNTIFLNSSSQVQQLQKLDKEIVRFNGQYVVKGEKKFSGKLKIGNLSVNFLNNNFMKSSFKEPAKIMDNNNFKRIIINGDLISTSASVENVNNVQLTSLKNAVIIDNENVINALNFSHVTVENLKITYHNGENITNYCKFIENLYGVRSLKKVIGKNVFASKVIGLKTINKMNENAVTKHFSMKFHSGRTLLYGKQVQFLGNVFVENFKVVSINNVNFVKLTETLFYRNWNQIVPAKHTFNKIKTSNLRTKYINNINLENLIRVNSQKPQNIRVNGRLVLQNGFFFNTVNAEELLCDLKGVVNKIKYPALHSWGNFNVLGSAILADENCLLGEIISRSSDKSKNYVVNEKVFLNENVNARNIYIKGKINGVNLSHIIEDALYITADLQVISGVTNFENLFTSGAEIRGVMKTGLVNGLDIKELDQRLVRYYELNNTLIKGKKIFYGGLRAEKVFTHRLFDVDPKVLVNLDNMAIIPVVYFSWAHINNNFDIEFVNNINVTYTLENLLKKHSFETQQAYGSYFFENMELQGDSALEEINGIYLKNIVTDEGQQQLDNSITFKDVVVNRRVKIQNINKRDSNNVFGPTPLGKNSVYKAENIDILAPSSVTGNIDTLYINGYSIEELKKNLEIARSGKNVEYIKSKLDLTKEVIQKTLTKINQNSGKYFYIEESMHLQISLPRTETAYAVENDGYVMLHILGKEKGESCGLPSNCHCVIQHNIQISPHLSVHAFTTEGPQRVFSYSDENIIINVITNTVSTSEQCRHPDSRNEVTHITWTRKNRKNQIGSSFIHPESIFGYISGVKYFVNKDDVYIVISLYDAKCLVMKISNTKEEIILQQEIESGRAPVLDLFYSAQGVVLIICSTRNDSIYNNTGIYRFNESTEKFVLLRFIPGPGCSSVTAVVQTSDSFIIMQQDNLPLEVYKYSHYYDNYYFYQHFLLDSQVVGVSVFYSGGFGISDAFLCIVTENGQFYVSSFQHIQGWMLESKGELEGIQALIPFELNNKVYMFAPSVTSSSLLTVLKHGII